MYRSRRDSCRWLLLNPEELTDELLVRRFTRYAEAAEDPNSRPSDWLNFARWGVLRDEEIGKTGSDAVTGPVGWLPIYREAERLIRFVLWPAVKAVGDKLSWSTADLSLEDVAGIATTALAAPPVEEWRKQAKKISPSSWPTLVFG